MLIKPFTWYIQYSTATWPRCLSRHPAIVISSVFQSYVPYLKLDVSGIQRSGGTWYCPVDGKDEAVHVIIALPPIWALTLETKSYWLNVRYIINKMNCSAIRKSLWNTRNFNITETHYDFLNFISVDLVLAIKIYTFHSNFINPLLNC